MKTKFKKGDVVLIDMGSYVELGIYQTTIGRRMSIQVGYNNFIGLDSAYFNLTLISPNEFK